MITPSEFQRRQALVVRAPTLSREELIRYQAALSLRLARHAYERVPYYRELFDSRGVHPDQIRSPADFLRVPISSREELQSIDPARLLASGVEAEGLTVDRSSGSSGVPMVVRHTHLERSLYLLLRSRTFALLSDRFGGRITYVGLDSRTPEQKRRGTGGPLTVVECRQPLERIVDEIVASRPDVIIGYPSVLAEIAQGAPAETRALLRPRLTVTSGEVLTAPVRRCLEESFGAPVTSTYASTECFWMGGECPQTGELHVLDDSLVLEVLDPEGRPVAPGEAGEVVVTSLHSFAQPFLRYRIGDVAVQGTAPTGGPRGCPCGRPFSTLAEVRGRMLDYLTLPDGRRVHSYELTLPLRDGAPFLQRYQIVQESRERIRIRMVCQRPPTAGELGELQVRLEGTLGAPGIIEIEPVEHIEREASGKFRLVISTVPRG